MINGPGKTEKLTGVKGMNDILPKQAALWEFFETTACSILRAYGYQNIRTPIIEHTRLFARSIGAATDIVEKEMYSFVDALNGEQLTLRPENTAAVVRASVEHSLLYDGPKRLWYLGPMFRHERPQRGRYRQFHQLGVESLGFAGPDADAENILMCQRLWHHLGLTDIRLEINSLGQADERAAHREQLIVYLKRHLDGLDEDAKRRLTTNPLRVLDSKNPTVQEIVRDAPKLIDFLGPASLNHFEGLQALLKANDIRFEINPRLVRGLDYYNLTVFEWMTDQLGAQRTVVGGGRYDTLVEQLGGKPAPACGWALGIERIIALLSQRDLACAADHCDIYLVHHGDAARVQAMRTAEHLRDAGLNIILHCNADGSGASFKSQMKRADASGAAYAVILGDAEIAAQSAAVKPLRTGGGQQSIALSQLADYLVSQCKAVVGHMAGSQNR